MAHMDLNLLVVLDALLREQSVTRAALRLGSPQSTVSTALARLREALGDPLFVRERDGLRPTPRAEALRGPVQESLARLEAAFRPLEPFDPASSAHTFHVAATDYTQFVLLAPLLQALEQRAPRVALRVGTVSGSFPWSGLAEGSLDLVLAGESRPPAGLRRRLLFQDRLACLLREGHPALARPFTLEAFLALRHVEVYPVQGPTLVDQLLARPRDVALALPQFLEAPFVVARTDLCFSLARRIAEPLATLLPLRILDPPFEAPPLQVHAYWHAARQEDSAHRWLRETLSGVARGL